MKQNLTLSGSVIYALEPFKECITLNVPGGLDDFIHLTFYCISLEGSEVDFYDVLESCNVTDPEVLNVLKEAYLIALTHIVNAPFIEALYRSRLSDVTVHDDKIVLELICIPS